MADRDRAWKRNAPGRFYVDDACIDCNLCEQIAPAHFTADDAEGHDYVFKQPETESEVAQCYEALEACPVGAIGDDGDTD